MALFSNPGIKKQRIKSKEKEEEGNNSNRRPEKDKVGKRKSKMEFPLLLNSQSLELARDLLNSKVKDNNRLSKRERLQGPQTAVRQNQRFVFLAFVRWIIDFWKVYGPHHLPCQTTSTFFIQYPISRLFHGQPITLQRRNTSSRTNQPKFQAEI